MDNTDKGNRKPAPSNHDQHSGGVTPDAAHSASAQGTGDSFDQFCSTDEELLRAVEEAEGKKMAARQSDSSAAYTHSPSTDVRRRTRENPKDNGPELHIVTQLEREKESEKVVATPSKRKYGLPSAVGSNLSQDSSASSVASFPQAHTESPYKRMRRVVHDVTVNCRSASQQGKLPLGRPATTSAVVEPSPAGPLWSTARVRSAYAALRPRSLLESFSESIDDEENSSEEVVQDSKERQSLKMWMKSLCRTMEAYLRQTYERQKMFVSSKMPLSELIDLGRKISVPLPFIQAMHEIRFMGEMAKYPGSFPSKKEVQSKVRVYQAAKREFETKQRANQAGGRQTEFV